VYSSVTITRFDSRRPATSIAMAYRPPLLQWLATDREVSHGITPAWPITHQCAGSFGRISSRSIIVGRCAWCSLGALECRHSGPYDLSPVLAYSSCRV